MVGDHLRHDRSPCNNGNNIIVLVMVWRLAKYLVASIEEGIIIVLTTTVCEATTKIIANGVKCDIMLCFQKSDHASSS